MLQLFKSKRSSLATSANVLAQMPTAELVEVLGGMTAEDQLQLVYAADRNDRRILVSASPYCGEILNALPNVAVLDMIAGGHQREWIEFFQFTETVKTVEVIYDGCVRTGPCGHYVVPELARNWLELLLELPRQKTADILNGLCVAHPAVIVAGLNPVENDEVFNEIVQIIDDTNVDILYSYSCRRTRQFVHRCREVRPYHDDEDDDEGGEDDEL